MRHRKLILVMVLLSIVGSVVFIFLAQDHKDSRGNVKSVASLEIVRSDRVGLVIERDASLTKSSIGEVEKESGQLWEFTQAADSQQQFVINAFYEQGASLKKLTGYSKQPLRDSVMTNVNLQLPEQYPNYKEITQHNLTINGIEASETIFEYESKEVKVKQRLVLFFKNSDTAVYIRAQAKADDYDELNTRYFEPLLMSVKFQ